MTSDSNPGSGSRNEDTSQSKGVATAAPHETGRNRTPSLKRRFIIWGAAAGLVLTLAIAGALMLNGNRTKLDGLNDARAALESARSASAEVLDLADPLEPEVISELQDLLADVEDLLSEDPPSLMSFDIDNRVAITASSTQALEDPTAALEEAIETRKLYHDAVSDGQDELEDAQETLDSTEDQVLDEDAYDQLTDATEILEEALSAEFDESSADTFATQTRDVSAATDDVAESRSKVSNSHDEWNEAEQERIEEERRAEEEAQRAEEEAAQVDPDNYDTVSERDWLMVERDPDAHEGDRYQLYGYVTQADAATGNISIRVDTSPVQKYRWFDYDVNTFMVAGLDDVFSDVVQGDHVRILAEVEGAFSYNTRIGGSASAVLATAYDVEVIGQL